MPVSKVPDSRRRAVPGSVIALGLVLGLGACGGSSNPTSPSTPVAAAPTTTVVQQGTFTLGSVPDAQAAGLPADAARVDFTTSGTGTIQAVVDWTHASNPVGVGIYQGSCTFQQFYANSCAQLALQPATNTKPIRLSLPNAAGGAYTMVVVNAGSTSEAGSFQVLLTK